MKRLTPGAWQDAPARALHLYLAGGRYWIAAKSKPEARMTLRLTYGLVGLPVQGIALGEKLEDGTTAADLLALAGGRTAIIGRTHGTA